MKIKRHNCKSIKEFNKIYRKYSKYFNSKWDYQKYDYTWISYKAVHKDLYSKSLDHKAKSSANLKYILRECRENYGFEFIHRNGKTYKFVGVEITNEDYYYVFESSDGDHLSSSCVGYWTDIVHYYEKITN